MKTNYKDLMTLRFRKSAQLTSLLYNLVISKGSFKVVRQELRIWARLVLTTVEGLVMRRRGITIIQLRLSKSFSGDSSGIHLRGGGWGWRMHARTRIYIYIYVYT